MSIAAYAIKCTGRIDVLTVSPTQRGAKVNWLFLNISIPINATISDREIEQLWQQKSVERGATCVRVHVSEYAK